MHHRLIRIVAILCSSLGGLVPAAEPDVVAVVACDPYAELKKQVRWVGTLVDQPMLDGFAESFLMPITNFKGLAGLDVSRPLGLVVTAAGEQPVVHAYVPVKDLAKLLDALAGISGPVEEVDGVRRISPPGGMPLDIVERDGWGIIGPQGAPPPVADPTKLLVPVVNRFTMGVRAFPSRMPAEMRRSFRAMLDQAAAVAAAQGQQLDQAGLAGIMDNLAETEEVLLGLAIDTEAEQIALETQSRVTPESPAAGTLADMAKGAVTVASPATAGGGPSALSLRLAMAVPEALRQGAIAGLDTITAAEGSDAGTETAVAILKEALAAMIEAGGYDAAAAIDTSGVEGRAGQPPLPAVTAGMRVKDGAALEARVKKVLADAGELPNVKVTLDAGRAAGANLHRITLENLGFPGVEADADTMDITLAIAPAYCFILAGGDVPRRLEAVAAASGKPDATARPLADLNIAVGPVLDYLAAMSRLQDPDGEEAAGMEAAAKVAAAQKSALVQLLARPIERGMALRLAADAGAIRTVATSVKSQQAARPPFPATGGPDPIPFPVPVR